MKQMEFTNIHAYKADGFIRNWQEIIHTQAIPYQYAVMADQLPEPQSHTLQNFINAAKKIHGVHDENDFTGIVFHDSDAAKWAEAAAYTAATTGDPDIAAKLDAVIRLIADAQEPDGYLNTYFSLRRPDKKWTNLLEAHELYCAGHMIEAAVAHYEATGKRNFLDVMRKNADHIYKHFITERHEGWGGHPEIELALVKLYQATGDEKYLVLAKHFIDVRGTDTDFYSRENDRKGWKYWGMNPKDLTYSQAHAPVRQQKDAVGHAVRAAYLYAGMADIANLTDDSALFCACKNLWDSITKKRMYVTGGIGSTKDGEAFTGDYDLPNDTAYAESCAAAALIFFAARMAQGEIDGKYYDIAELAFYNAFLAGIQLDGKKFFYVNPLENIPGISGKISTHNHALSVRQDWFACACCPPNIARLLASFGKYAYGENEGTVFCNLYAAGKVQFGNGVQLQCTTGYPFDFNVQYSIQHGGKDIAVRIPAYSRHTTLKIDGKETEYTIKNGYIYIKKPISGTKIEIQLDNMPHKIYPHTKIFENSGNVAVSRGPIIYCFEGIDNAGDVLSLALKRSGTLTVGADTAPGGAPVLHAQAIRLQTGQSLYSFDPPKTAIDTATAIPYYTRANRGDTEMRVWLPEY
ncbi:MAG: glycoside hydrolase family 127 protein [Clostridia bacterium]|nr:glycoside hydrolase family 127 protein [Clostridia bacterium]